MRTWKDIKSETKNIANNIYDGVKDVKRENVGGLLKHYVVDSIGVILLGMPLFGAMETLLPEPSFPGLSSDESWEVRKNTLLLVAGGLALLYSKSRDASRWFFEITDKSPEKIKKRHDAVYGFVFSAGSAIPIYLSSGADWRAALTGAFWSGVFGFATTPANCYVLDVFRGLNDTIPSVRVPKIIQDSNKYVKKGLAVGMIGASALGLFGVYEFKDSIDQFYDRKIRVGKLEARIRDEKTFDASKYFLPSKYLKN